MVTAAIYGIKWAHSINGFEDPTVNSFVKNLLEAAKRQVRAPRRKKDCVCVSGHVDMFVRYS